MLSKLKVGIVMNDAMNSVSTPIDNIAFDFLSKNWVNLLLIVVGAFALLIYILQERRKITEAASLVILQMDELQERIKEIQSYIANGQLNDSNFPQGFLMKSLINSDFVSIIMLTYTGLDKTYDLAHYTKRAPAFGIIRSTKIHSYTERSARSYDNPKCKK